ncbi:YuzD family protein [Alteribacter natronophilus]|uniref:YuzD family protein n=1 Tax=Alteribacter natronophilus TaxID=2583810 RepID=UPI00110EAA4C|nr:YuzD family protein [Alteribacter natronophilus]TMW72491.1 DUF1462 family protein [Alteribacter natronophilus]
MSRILITVYGAEEKCASCINLPSALETKEWLEAAVARKFPEEPVSFAYCDIEAPEGEEQEKFAELILNDEYFYPLVVVNGEVTAEGDPRLPVIYRKIEQLLAEQTGAAGTGQARA